MIDIVLSPTIEPAKPIAKVPRLPRPGFGRMFEAMLKYYGDALNMAYVEPFRPSRRQKDRRI